LAFDTYTLAAKHRVEMKAETLAEKRQLLKMNALALKEIRQGLRQVYLAPASVSTEQDFPRIARFRPLARLLAAEGDVRLAENRVGEAAQSYLDAVQLGTQMMRGGKNLDAIVGIACQQIGRRGLWKVAPRLSEPEARRVIQRLQKIQASHVPLAEIFYEEGRFFQEGKATPLPTVTVDGKTEDPNSDWFVKYMNQGMVDYMNRVAHETAAPFPKRSNTVRRPRNPLVKTSSVHSAVERLWVMVDGSKAQNDLLILTLAAQAFHRTNGRYPNALEELVPDYLKKLPNDPFTGETPFRYGIKDKSYVLYSVGPDGVDDGGQPIIGITTPSSDPDEKARPRLLPASRGDIVAGVTTFL
jgi:hypothetical protein